MINDSQGTSGLGRVRVKDRNPWKTRPSSGRVRGRPNAWPPDSPDVTPQNYFLWVFVKYILYVQWFQYFDELNTKITADLIIITSELLWKLLASY